PMEDATSSQGRSASSYLGNSGELSGCRDERAPREAACYFAGVPSRTVEWAEDPAADLVAVGWAHGTAVVDRDDGPLRDPKRAIGQLGVVLVHEHAHIVHVHPDIPPGRHEDPVEFAQLALSIPTFMKELLDVLHRDEESMALGNRKGVDRRTIGGVRAGCVV